MPLRFNQKELVIIACRQDEYFDKQGVLTMRESEGKLFHKSEKFTERLVRLRGNLLFYFKTREQSSEVAGLIVLDHSDVLLNPDNRQFSFIIDFKDSDEPNYELVASSEEEMKSWIKEIKKAGYQKLSERVAELRKIISEFSGQDPLPDHEPVKAGGVDVHPTLTATVPTCNDSLLLQIIPPRIELCFACTAMSSVLDNNKAAFMIKVSTMMPFESSWSSLSQTEICEDSSEPFFLKTITLGHRFSMSTRLKLTVCDVRNRSKNQVVSLGQTFCCLKDIELSPSRRLSLPIKAMESDDSIGFLVIQACKPTSSNSFARRQNSLDFIGALDDEFLTRFPRTYVGQIVEKSFRFPTRYGDEVGYQELMGESLLSFRVPAQLLDIFVQEEKEAVLELHRIGNLNQHWENIKLQQQNSHFELVRMYCESISDLSNYEGRNFKRSSEKSDKELEFVTTNLHLQRIRVNDATNEEFCYDIITFGSPSAHSLKFRNGGLKRLLSSVEDSSRRMSINPSDSNVMKAGKKARNIKRILKQETDDILTFCGRIANSDVTTLGTLLDAISKKVAEILNLVSSSFIQEAEIQLNSARKSDGKQVVSEALMWTGNDFKNVIEDKEFKDKDLTDQGRLKGGEVNKGRLLMRQDVVHFVGFSDLSKWKRHRPLSEDAAQQHRFDQDCGLRDSLASCMSIFNNGINPQSKASGEDFKMKMVAASNHLSKTVQSFFLKFSVIMRFVLMSEEYRSSVNLRDIHYRRDIVLSQTLAPVIAGFTLKLSENIENKLFLDQISAFGVLAVFECLITPHGDEMAMLEDSIVGFDDLKKVRFKFTCDDGKDVYPLIQGNRCRLIVSIPLHNAHFNQLPCSLQNGKLIIIHPVVFNVGINEHATIAERFGDMSLQENLNARSLNYLFSYYEKFSSLYPHWVGTKSKSVVSLAMLMANLKVEIQSKKSKNTDILRLSEEICWRMNGIRLTSCKSAKDRTAMAVTLEAARILEREHGLLPEIFPRVLSTIRSQGTRLINSFKNVGIPKYAFNRMQVKAYPNLYRAPEGTYGRNVLN